MCFISQLSLVVFLNFGMNTYLLYTGFLIFLIIAIFKRSEVRGSKKLLQLLSKFQSVLPGNVEASTGFTLAFLESTDQYVSFGAPYTNQMLKPIS